MDHLRRKLKDANVSETAHIASKIRNLTPGAEMIIGRLQLDER